MISKEISQIKPTTPTTQSSFYQRKLLKLAVQKKQSNYKNTPNTQTTPSTNYLLTNSLIPLVI